MISIALDLLMQQVGYIIYRKIKSIHSSETWQIGNSVRVVTHNPPRVVTPITSCGRSAINKKAHG